MTKSHPGGAVDVAVLGAGPTGLGAAWRLEELRAAETLGRPIDWALFEVGSTPGGLASSEVDEHGFRWDLGGHVIYSHYAYFDDVLARVIPPEGWLQHVRERWVRLCDRWLPYPVQRNLHRLPIGELMRCVRGLLEARDGALHPSSVRNFADWLRASFGRGLDELFFTPFNRKMWATEPCDMGVDWTAGRSGSTHANVPTVDLPRLIENVVRRRDDLGWSPDQRFPYPSEGGTGAIWRGVCAALPAERVHFGCEVRGIDAARRTLHLASGERVRYGALVSGLPLDILVARLEGRADLVERVRALRHTSVHAIGLGFDEPLPEELEAKCWLYFADPAVPFYRATVLSTYSPNNVPRPGRQCSLLLEVATAKESPLDPRTLVPRCEAALRESGVLPRGMRTVARWHRRVPRGYPVPTLGRDAILDPIDAELRAARIWSRGRFGGWKYEVSNQDHAFHQGVEAVDAALLGAPETTWPDPETANSGSAPLPSCAREVNT